jgi:hypothetical protein
VPAALLTATVDSAACFAAGRSALAGALSQQAITLAEGVLHAMWMTRCKTALLVVLAAGLVCTGMGGLTWNHGPRAHAQPSPAASGEEARRDRSVGDDSRDADEVERQLKDLQRQVAAKQRQLARLRQGNALEQIEAALKKLQQANASDPNRRAAVEEFSRAFGKLKRGLTGRTTAELYKSRVRSVYASEFLNAFKRRMVSNGRVLQVDLEKKQVLLSIGSKDGVKKGQLYRVYQAGKSSPDQTGWVRITQVDSKWSTAAIVGDYGPRAPIRPNQEVQLHEGRRPKGVEGEQ